MGKSPWMILFIVIVWVGLVACGPEADPQTGPLLMDEVTLVPSGSGEPGQVVVAASPLPVGITPEIVSPLEQVTVQSDYVLVTPTLPPSKTPTLTPTHTPTPTLTRTPTVTVTATSTAYFFPTSEIIPVTRAVVNPLNEVCDSTWFFIQPRPDSCPLNPPTASQGVYQQFENGYMIWVGSADAIYVMYNDGIQPRWQVFRDHFEEGMPEFSGDYLDAPRDNIWQPRRGFGMLWRGNQAVRDRIGWAVEEWEQPFSVRVQIAKDGTLFMNDPQSIIFSLIPGGANWQRATSSGF